MAILHTAVMRLFLKEFKARGKSQDPGQRVLYTITKNSSKTSIVQATFYSCYCTRIIGS